MLLTSLLLSSPGLLIAVHEYGHYRVAVACGVKVLRFSVGFGKPLLRWQAARARRHRIRHRRVSASAATCDARRARGARGREERHLAFNTQPLRRARAIVAAGPLANLLLAVLLYALVNWIGVNEPRAVLASRWPARWPQQAGLHGGELVRQAGLAGMS
jgi:regulator of sigma E protease